MRCSYQTVYYYLFIKLYILAIDGLIISGSYFYKFVASSELIYLLIKTMWSKLISISYFKCIS